MMRSMFAGVSGLKNHQIKMDVIGNNIANVNTIGFKGGRVNFQDILSQTMKGASEPRAGRGGTNPIQIGLGSGIATVDVLHTQGNLQNTSKVSDLAIQGEGFFILGDGSNQYYTRAGNFNMEQNGNLVNPANGLILQGWTANNDGTIDYNSPIRGIQLPIGQNIAPSATTTVGFGSNLDANTTSTLGYKEMTITAGTDSSRITIDIVADPDNYNIFNYKINASNGAIVSATNADGFHGKITVDSNGSIVSRTGAPTVTIGTNPAVSIVPPAVGAAKGGSFSATVGTDTFTAAGTFDSKSVTTTTDVYDSLGTKHTIATKVTKSDVNTWEWVTTDASGNTIGNGVLNFNSLGELVSASGTDITFNPAGADPVIITPDFDAVTQFTSTISEITSPDQNGYSMGQLQSFNIDKIGQVIGVFSNGRSQVLAQLATASFNNPSGLLRSGDTMFAASANSGTPQIGQAGFNGRGYISSGTLEMSNVDLSQEFTDMIVTQRGFQSNSRIITTSDELLQELVGLKR
ncbi:MAG TPA: flagellar hook protein FlgE [Bacillota bacterium]|nr:flagellar hook protein FlgE [Bacillota bacterium]